MLSSEHAPSGSQANDGTEAPWAGAPRRERRGRAADERGEEPGAGGDELVSPLDNAAADAAAAAAAA
jgi:hypothetical protein